MSAAIDIPGYLTRPLAAADLADVVAVVNALEKVVDGKPSTTATEIEVAWSRRGFALETMSIGVERGGRLVAVGEVLGERADVSVHPEFLGRGIGGALARWTWEVAAANGQDQVGQTVNDADEAARELFAALGYRQRWTSWALEVGLDEIAETPSLPPQASLRPATLEDARSLYRIVEDAFNEWPDRSPTTYEDWRAAIADNPLVRLDLSIVATWDDEPVGVGIAFQYEDDPDEAWVEQIAVAAPHRGKRLARAILTRMFHDFSAAGFRRAGLSTDSRTGAFGLYEHVGMAVTRSYTRWSKHL